MDSKVIEELTSISPRSLDSPRPEEPELRSRGSSRARATSGADCDDKAQNSESRTPGRSRGTTEELESENTSQHEPVDLEKEKQKRLPFSGQSLAMLVRKAYRRASAGDAGTDDNKTAKRRSLKMTVDSVLEAMRGIRSPPLVAEVEGAKAKGKVEGRANKTRMIKTVAELRQMKLQQLVGKSAKKEPSPDAHSDRVVTTESRHDTGSAQCQPVSPSPTSPVGNSKLFDHKSDSRKPGLGNAYRRLSMERHNIKVDITRLQPDKPGGCLVLHPQGFLRVSWDILTMVLLLYIAVVTPVRIGFDIDAKGAAYYFEFAIDGIFMADVLLNFRTGFISKNGKLVMSPCRIATHYFRTWFIVDLVSSLPIDLFLRG